ncbi:aldo/keto reductase [Hydrogenophaga sp.]|uniref:aldo/keto reductase n=1 Tax=Hydrogenophaga sp. TaxID=1904254 RepID=UPI002724358F|nr:aldo/keto reductase [Hydrogenophaga sp.]MDO9436272.1 aldo/keto reductase [Hydrogenophaga sp.]
MLKAFAMPRIGMGTAQLRGPVLTALVQEAIAIGYRHIDTAIHYDNAQDIGAGIRQSGIDREHLFVTTKMSPRSLTADKVRASMEQALRDLGTDYVDLLLIHWPNPAVPLEETLGAFSELKRQQWIRHIGVSNFTTPLLDEAQRACSDPIVVNQVEYHPYLSQSTLVSNCRARGVAITAFSPLAAGRVHSDPVITAIAKEKNRSNAQVVLRWLLQQPGISAIPRSSNPQRLRENIDVQGFELTPQEMDLLFGLARTDGRLVNSTWSPSWDGDSAASSGDRLQA